MAILDAATSERLFGAIRTIKAGGPGALNQADVDLVNAALAGQAVVTPVAPTVPYANGTVTVRVASEIIDHEAIVFEWYKDSEGVGTWGIGVTDKSGHKVLRYKDAPQTLKHVLEVYIWLLRNAYIPDVLKAFGDHKLTEAQFAAAVSFHYNTGAILKTEWVNLFLAGKLKEARTFWENHYLNGGDLKKRRLAEAALFFDGTWQGDGKATTYEVNKPSYTPKWSSAKRIDIAATLAEVLAA